MKRAAAVLICLLILLPFPGAKAAGSAAEATKRCTIELENGVGEASFLTDGSALTHVRVQPGGTVTVRSETELAAAYLSWYALPEAVELTQYDAAGAQLSKTPLSPGMLNHLLPLEPGCTGFCIAGDGGFCLSDVRVFGDGALPNDVQNWERSDQAALLVAVADAEDAVGSLGALLAIYAAEHGLPVQVVSMTTPASRAAQEEILKALWTLGVRAYPVFGAFPAAENAAWGAVAASWGYGETRAFLAEQLRLFRPRVVVATGGETGVDAFLAQQMQWAALRAGDAAQYPASAHLGAWRAEKLYIADADGTTVMEDSAPLACFLDGTAAEAAEYAYSLLKTARVLQDTAQAQTRFTLIYSDVGRDTEKNDLFEHIAAVGDAPRAPVALPKATPVPTPSPTPAPGEPIPVDSLTGDGFRRDFDPPEYVCADLEHNHWEYRSDTLSVFVDQYEYEGGEDGMSYFIAEIRQREIDAFLPALAVGGAERARTMAHRMQAVLFLSGDGLSEETADAPRLRAGSVYGDGAAGDCLAMLPSGGMLVVLPGERDANALLAMGVQNTFAAGPWLVHGGVVNEAADAHPAASDRTRLAVGMAEPGHYFVFASDGGGADAIRSIPLSEVASALSDYGCTEAYNLKGGANVNLIFMGESLNGTTRRRGGRIRNTSGDCLIRDGLVFGRSPLVPVRASAVSGALANRE